MQDTALIEEDRFIVATAMTDYQKTWRCWIGGIASTPILDPFGELPALFVPTFASAEASTNAGLVLIAAVVLLAAAVFMHAVRKARLRKKAQGKPRRDIA